MKQLQLTVFENATLWGRIAPEFVSFTMDWWGERHIPWGNSSVLNVNFQDPQLIALASALAPSFWRIGGSQADTIVYDIISAPFDDGNATKTKSKCKRNRCLTMDRWDEILDFGHQIGARIVFGLNYLSHTTTPSGRDTRDWDSTVTRQFLNYTRHHKRGHVIYGYELGNELTHGGKASNLTRMVVAYQELRSIVDELYRYDPPDSRSRELTKPKIMGPASTGRGTLVRLLKKLGPELDIVTHHKYHARGGETSTKQDREVAMRPSFHTHAYHYRDTANAVDKYFVQQRKSKHPTSTDSDNNNKNNNILWIGEGAMSYNSGLPGVTNTMISSFWYANLLAVLSKTQPIAHSVYCRQALLGGYYELIQHNKTKTRNGQMILKPNPDYWIARLYKRTVGQASIGPITSMDKKHRRPKTPEMTWGCCKGPGKDTLVVHSFCAAPTTLPLNSERQPKQQQLQTKPGDATLVLINMDAKTDFSIKLPMGHARSQFQMTSASPRNGTSTQEIQINQQHMDGSSNYSLLGAPTQEESRQPLWIPRESITFVVIHGASIQSCMDLYQHDEEESVPLSTTAGAIAVVEYPPVAEKTKGGTAKISDLRSPSAEDIMVTPREIHDTTLDIHFVPSLFVVWFLVAIRIIAKRIWAKKKTWV